MQLHWTLTGQHLLQRHWLLLAGLHLCCLPEGAAACAHKDQHDCHLTV